MTDDDNKNKKIYIDQEEVKIARLHNTRAMVVVIV
jgi:hypothetical protein